MSLNKEMSGQATAYARTLAISRNCNVQHAQSGDGENIFGLFGGSPPGESELAKKAVFGW